MLRGTGIPEKPGQVDEYNFDTKLSSLTQINVRKNKISFLKYFSLNIIEHVFKFYTEEALIRYKYLVGNSVEKLQNCADLGMAF